MPEPKSFDNKDDFLKVCIPQVIKEGKTNDQAVAQCNSMWAEKDKSKLKLETVNIGDVEIFETGTWKGDKYNEKDLDEMINNFNNGVAEPYMTIDHSDKATAQFKDALEALSLGFVSKLARKGKKLIADFKQVPKTIADLVEVGALKKKSIEFFRQFVSNDKLYKNVLQGVTFHGANGLPEVNTLSDFLNLYKSNLQVMVNDNKGIVSLKNSDLKKNKEASMDKIELKQEEYNELLKLKSQYVTMQEENDKLQEENKEVKEEADSAKEKTEEVTKENEELKEQVDNQEKEKEKELKKEAISYIDDKIKNGFIKPAHKDRYVNEYVTYKKDEKLFKDFTEDIDSRNKIINFNPVNYDENQTTTNFKYDPEKMEYKAGATINYDELHEQVSAIAKAKNISYADAMIEAGVVTEGELGLTKEA